MYRACKSDLHARINFRIHADRWTGYPKRIIPRADSDRRPRRTCLCNRNSDPRKIPNGAGPCQFGKVPASPVGRRSVPCFKIQCLITLHFQNRDADERRKRRFFLFESAKISVFMRPKSFVQGNQIQRLIFQSTLIRAERLVRSISFMAITLKLIPFPQIKNHMRLFFCIAP